MNPGTAAALLAYGLWGVMPLYFQLMGPASAVEVLAQRVLWSLGLLLVVLLAQRQLGALWRQLAPRLLANQLLAALLVGANWLTYVWAAMNGHAVDASLGYFILPLFSVALAVLLLDERLEALEWAGVAAAAAGVVWLTVVAGRLPWVALVLALSFGLYGLIKKRSPLPAVPGLALETALLAPLAAAALAWLAVRGELAFGHAGWRVNVALASTGLLTALPLAAFGYAAQRLGLAALGMLQYISPTLQFLIAVTLLGESVDARRLLGFGLVWLGLALFTLALWRRQRARVA